MKIKKQQDIRDCGINVIQALNAFFHGKFIDENKIKKNAQYGEKGISAKNLINLGNLYGIKLTPYKVNYQDLKDSEIKKYLVAIIKSKNESHYVIIKIKKKIVIIFDSINGKKILSWKKFAKKFLKVIFIVEKQPFSYKQNLKDNFLNQKTNENKLLFRLLINKIPYLIIIFLLIIINNTLMFASSFFIKIIIDKIIPHFLKNTLLIIFLGFSFLAITRVLGLILQNYLTKKITIEYEWNLYNLFLKKLKQTLFSQLQKLSSGDYLRRMFLISEISNFVVNFYLIVFHHSLILIVSTSILMWLSFKMFALTLLIGFLMIIATFFFQIKIKFLSQKMIKNEQRTLNMFSDIVNLLNQLKTKNYAKFLKKYYIKTLEINKISEYKIWKINWYQNLINQLFLLISPIFLIYIGTNLVFSNNLSIGNLLFFTNFFHYFIDMLKNITTFCLNFHYKYKNIKSLEFFLDLENEKILKNTLILTKIVDIKLAKIQINNQKFTLKITKLSIKNNIHLQGPNGSGKTTLLNIVSARYFGDNEIFVNNLPLSKYNLSEYRNKICFITNNEYLPNVNIWQYITLEETDAQKIFWHNYQRYFLAQIFNKLKIDINYKMTNNGYNLSSGQRQFIICLRLLAFKYDLIILDEVIENIDNEILKNLKWAINDFQKAIFIEISHSQKYLTKGVTININDIKKN